MSEQPRKSDLINAEIQDYLIKEEEKRAEDASHVTDINELATIINEKYALDIDVCRKIINKNITNMRNDLNELKNND